MGIHSIQDDPENSNTTIFANNSPNLATPFTVPSRRPPSHPRSDPDLLEGDALLRAREGLGALQAPN